MKRILVQKYFRKKMPYQEYWLSIIQDTNQRFKQKSIDEQEDLRKDDYFEEVPYSIEFISEKNMIYSQRVDFSNFTLTPIDEMNFLNLFISFTGILNFIFINSTNKLNINELEFHFSGGKSLKAKDPNNFNRYNIINIFDYQNIMDEFVILPTPNAFFGVTFKNIQIEPLAYSIRSGAFIGNVPHLVSFIFEAYDEDKLRWDVLDERVNINDLLPMGSFGTFFVRSTGKSYSSFRITQIEPGSNNFWGFGIAAFEIHGSVSYRQFSDMQLLSGIRLKHEELSDEMLYGFSNDNLAFF